MIHGYNTIEMLALEEDGIAGKWPLSIDAFGLSCFDCRCDGLNLLSPERTILAIVRV